MRPSDRVITLTFKFQSICVNLGCPSISNIYFVISNGNLDYGLRLLETDDNVMYMLELYLN